MQRVIGDGSGPSKRGLERARGSGLDRRTAAETTASLKYSYEIMMAKDQAQTDAPIRDNAQSYVALIESRQHRQDIRKKSVATRLLKHDAYILSAGGEFLPGEIGQTGR